MKRLSEQTLQRRRTLFWFAVMVLVDAIGTTACVLVSGWIFIPFVPVHVFVLCQFLDVAEPG